MVFEIEEVYLYRRKFCPSSAAAMRPDRFNLFIFFIQGMIPYHTSNGAVHQSLGMKYKAGENLSGEISN